MPSSPAVSPPVLPRVVLTKERIPLNVLRFVPIETARKYQVVPFAASEDVLKLALVHPDQLKQGFFVALKDMGQKLGREIKLYQTDPASLQAAVKQYQQQLSAPAAPTQMARPKDPAPPLFELGRTVAFNYLRRVPVAYARDNRLMCVDFLPPKAYWFLTDRPYSKDLQKQLDEIEHENQISIYPLIATTKDFEDLYSYYAKTVAEREQQEAWLAPKPKKELEPKEMPVKKDRDAEMPGPPELKVAKGVIISEIQGGIISTEEEKTGLAGLFQKVNHTFAPSAHVPEAESASVVAPLPVVPPIPPAIPVAQPVLGPALIGGQPVAAATVETKPMPAANPLTPNVSVIEAAVESPTAPATPAVTEDGVSAADLGKSLSKPIETLEELKEQIKKGFIPRMVAATVSYAIHEKASDIHIESFEDEVRVRYRIDGQLTDIVKLSPDVHAAMVSRIKILARLRLDESRVPQDGRFDVAFDNAQVDLRVSVMPTVHGEKVVMRILDKSKGIVSLEALGIQGLGYDNIIKAINKPFGICLATGPTGSGKSTSLYAILNRIATPNVNVITLEDPVEYEMKGINQSQIRPKIGFTFAEGLRAVLRQDPNIIMVGEIRDGETANMATQAALTGHLVLSTLHTNDAAGAIPRLNNMGIEPFLITSSLNVAIGQRLVRKICQNCKSDITMPAGIQEKIGKDLEEIGRLNPQDAKRLVHPFKFYQGTGCSECNGSGYRGRVGIYEVLPMSEALEDMTVKHAAASAIQEQAQKEGMLTMYQDGLLKVIAGITTLDEVLRETSNK